MFLFRRFRPKRLLVVAGVALVCLIHSGSVMAAEHSQSGPAFDDSPLPFLFAAYTITWAAFFAYAFYINRRQRELRREINDLKRTLEEKGNSQSSV